MAAFYSILKISIKEVMLSLGFVCLFADFYDIFKKWLQWNQEQVIRITVQVIL